MSAPEPYDHFEATDSAIPNGVYRVVGRDGDSVTLLRVGDADERRVHTGELVTVDAETLDGLRPARNPDGNRRPGDRLRSKMEAGYWSVRAFGRQLLANPIPASLAGTLLLGGVLGEPFVSLPGAVFDVFAVLGALGLAYVGSGRLSSSA